MKRAMSFALAMVMLLGVVFSASNSASAAKVMTTSEECIEILKAYEGFCEYPYQDYGQWTVGYGTKCPEDKLATYKANGITEEEAEELLQVYVKNYEEDLNYFIDKYDLDTTQSEFDAMFLFTYNCGSGWIFSSSTNFHETMADPNATADEILFYFGLWSNAGNVPLTGLINRRLAEANMYINGVYSSARPSNYCYVKYDANGGVVEGRVHAYNINSNTQKPLTPSYSGRTFEGWYTAKTGGTQVTKLTASLDGLTLYARWSGSQEETKEPTDTSTPVEIELPAVVKVTTDELNVRKGPGTNYTTVGIVHEGDQLSLTKVVRDSSDRLWGEFDKGWICLAYTNYGKTAEEPDNGEQTAPEETKPEEDTSSGEDEGVMGTVTANGGLNVRSGAGTGYRKVGDYAKNARIKILEQKVVGSMVWGRTDKGWVSMSYVKLDSDSSADTNQNTGSTESTGSSVTGTVKVNGVLNIRSGAGTGYKIAGYYNNGAKVTITEQKTNGGHTWGKTAKGWISMSYVVLNSTSGSSTSGSSTSGSSSGSSSSNSNTSTGTETNANANATVNVTSVLNIRSGAGGNYGVVGYYKNGARIEITEKKTVAGVVWGKTSRGWVSLNYVKLDKTSEPESGESADTNQKTVTATCLNIRADANTTSKVVGYLYKGAKVTITETKTVGSMTWGKTAKGWICMDYVK